MTNSSVAAWPGLSWVDESPRCCGQAADALATRSGGAGDPLEGVLHFAVRWDAVSKASHLQVLTRLVWEVVYDAHIDRFRVALDDDSIRRVDPASMQITDEKVSPAVDGHRFDRA